MISKKNIIKTYYFTATLSAVSLFVAAYVNLQAGYTTVSAVESVVALFLIVSLVPVYYGKYVYIFSSISLYAAGAILLFSVTQITGSDPGPYIGIVALLTIAYFLLSNRNSLIVYGALTFVAFLSLFMLKLTPLTGVGGVKFLVGYLVVFGIILLNRSVAQSEMDQMESEEQKVRALINGLTEGVVFFDTKKKAVLINPALVKMTGLPKEGFYLSEITRLFAGSEVDLENKLNEALRSGETTRIEEAQISKFFYEIAIVAIKDSSGRISGGAIILHDISKIKDVDRLKSDFIATASHQLRTPMTGITWVAERLLKTEKFTKEGKEYLLDIHNSVHKLTKLVDSLLNVSRIESNTIGVESKDIDVIELVNGFLEESSPLFKKKNLTLVFKEKPKDLMVSSDESALRNIAQSIISNAIEYTPDGGTIEIQILKEEKNFILKVSDTGIGIPEKDQLTIFDKFTRADNARNLKVDGTGLGMYIAKQAAELLDGQITLTSPVPGREGEKNQGTLFVITLPIQGEVREGDKKLA